MFHCRNHFFRWNINNIIFFYFFSLFYWNILMIFLSVSKANCDLCFFSKSTENSVQLLPCLRLTNLPIFISSGQKPLGFFYKKLCVFFPVLFSPQIMLILSDQFISTFSKAIKLFNVNFLIFIPVCHPISFM